MEMLLVAACEGGHQFFRPKWLIYRDVTCVSSVFSVFTQFLPIPLNCAKNGSKNGSTF